jgi:hypothetical protein
MELEKIVSKKATKGEKERGKIKKDMWNKRNNGRHNAIRVYEYKIRAPPTSFFRKTANLSFAGR